MTVEQKSRDLCFDLPLAEQGFIGALLVRPALTGEMAGQVSPEDLLTPMVNHIYAAMVSLWGRGIEPTRETVEDSLRAAGVLESIGGRAVIGTLIAHADSSYPSKYVPSVLDHSLRRKVNVRLRQALEFNIDPKVTAADSLDNARELLADIEVPVDCPSEAETMPIFCAGEDIYDWLVPDLIERGDRLLIVAAEGAGKSMMSRQIAVCCAIGVHPFGGAAFAPIRVLLLDLENPVSLGRRKLRPMYATARQLRPQADHSNLSVICKPGGIDVTRRSDARWLSAQLTHARPDLVVLGPLYKLASGDDNWERGAARVTALLDDLRDRLQFGLVMETHAPQSIGGARHLRPVGSSMWLRWPEFILTFSALQTDPNKVAVSLTKGRDERVWPRYLGRGGVWPWTPCGETGPIDSMFYDEEF